MSVYVSTHVYITYAYTTHYEIRSHEASEWFEKKQKTLGLGTESGIHRV